MTMRMPISARSTDSWTHGQSRLFGDREEDEVIIYTHHIPPIICGHYVRSVFLAVAVRQIRISHQKLHCFNVCLIVFLPYGLHSILCHNGNKPLRQQTTQAWSRSSGPWSRNILESPYIIPNYVVVLFNNLFPWKSLSSLAKLVKGR